GGENEVELPRSSGWTLRSGVVCGHIHAVSRELVRPRLRLAPVRPLRTDKAKAKGGEAIEDGAIAPAPVLTASLSVAVKNVEVSRCDDAVPELGPDEHREIGDESL